MFLDSAHSRGEENQLRDYLFLIKGMIVTDNLNNPWGQRLQVTGLWELLTWNLRVLFLSQHTYGGSAWGTGLHETILHCCTKCSSASSVSSSNTAPTRSESRNADESCLRWQPPTRVPSQTSLGIIAVPFGTQVGQLGPATVLFSAPGDIYWQNYLSLGICCCRRWLRYTSSLIHIPKCNVEFISVKVSVFVWVILWAKGGRFVAGRQGSWQCWNESRINHCSGFYRQHFSRAMNKSGNAIIA